MSHRTNASLFFVTDLWLNVNSPNDRFPDELGLLRDNHKHSPYQRIQIEVFHFIF